MRCKGGAYEDAKRCVKKYNELVIATSQGKLFEVDVKQEAVK